MLIPTLLLVTLVIFFVVRLIPGDIIDAMLAVPGAWDMVIDRAVLEQELGLDAPALVQYGRWMGVVPQGDGGLSGIFQGNLGASWWLRMSVVELVALKWPVTFELGIIGLIIS